MTGAHNVNLPQVSMTHAQSQSSPARQLNLLSALSGRYCPAKELRHVYMSLGHGQNYMQHFLLLIYVPMVRHHAKTQLVVQVCWRGSRLEVCPKQLLVACLLT